MTGRAGVGSVKWDKQPADDPRVSPFKCTLTFIPDAKP